MIEIELPEGLEDRFAALAAKRGLTKTICARKLFIELIEDMEDTELALDVMKTSERRWTTEELKAELGLEN